VWEQSAEDPRATMEPHVYEVSALAFKGLSAASGEGINQSILVSGESGAGKTETIKICLDHITSIQRGKASPGYCEDSECDKVVQRIVQSNPLLEAFGNATTRRNANSSRFGRYIQLQFDKKAHKPAACRLVGSRSDVYLLEKTRVVRHHPDEQTFHIFYQLLAASDTVKARFWKRLCGANNESFKYVGPTAADTIEGLTEAGRFCETLASLELVGVQGESLDTLMKAVCVVMQLGNLSFEAPNGDSDKSRVAIKAELSALSDLMGVPETALELSFTEQTFRTAREIHKVPLNPEAAKEACDALAKDVYHKIFLWLVSEINKATSASESQELGTIGLLDIFGFEHFAVNRFEQLCINYANEKLQQKFTDDIFRSVQDEYESEGIPLAAIWYDDNAAVLDLIEAPTGLLNLLNEECIRPKGNDFTFVQKTVKMHGASPALIVHQTDRLSFGIQHFIAGRVMYDAKAFVAKNTDTTLSTDLQACSEQCTNAIIRKKAKAGSFREQADLQRSNTVVPGSTNTVWTKYKTQLSLLMRNLRTTKTQYIRCIRPNCHHSMQPLVFDHTLVVDQLRSAGVVAGITLSRSVYPNRLPNSVVLARYSSATSMWNNGKKSFPADATSTTARMNIPQKRRVQECQALLDSFLLQPPPKTTVNGQTVQSPAFVVGKTRTYFGAGVLEMLEAGHRCVVVAHNNNGDTKHCAPRRKNTLLKTTLTTTWTRTADVATSKRIWRRAYEMKTVRDTAAATAKIWVPLKERIVLNVLL
jgi:myosin V